VDRSDSFVGWTLLGGLVLSIGVMALGLILEAIKGDAGSGHVLPLDQILPNLGKARPSAVLDLGILVLFATPVAGVVVALAEFTRRREVPFMLISALLLIILAGGFALALR
jgi:uncharacterized membrane protein